MFSLSTALLPFMQGFFLMQVRDSGFILKPSAIWKITAASSQGILRSAIAPTPCSGTSQFELYDFKRKVYILNDLEQACVLYNESSHFH